LPPLFWRAKSTRSRIEDAIVNKQWLSETTERLKLDFERARLKAEKLRIENEIRRTGAPEAWNQLRTWLNVACSQLNTALKRDDLLRVVAAPPSELLIEAKTSTSTNRLTAEFDPSSHVITYTCNSHTVQFSPIVEDSQLHFTDGGDSLSVESIGQRLLEDVLGHLR
jgi:hypothetical protein